MTLPDFLIQDSHGEIFLRGHRIGLMHIVDCYHDGYSAEKLHEQFPTLSLELIRKVLTFYEQNRIEVDHYLAECHEVMERNYSTHQPGPGAQRLRKLKEQLQRAEVEKGDDPQWATLSLQEKLRWIEMEERGESN